MLLLLNSSFTDGRDVLLELLLLEVLHTDEVSLVLSGDDELL